jgi:AbrB family looped-hinge helix DNA binding protein
MASATLTSKGQITIPASVRAVLGLKAGTRIEFVEISKGRYEIIPATISIQSMEGMFYKPGQRAVTIEEMNEAIAEAGASAGKITR